MIPMRANIVGPPDVAIRIKASELFWSIVPAGILGKD
jgi:hypothetical protein